MIRPCVFRGWRAVSLVPALALAACTASNLNELKRQNIAGQGFHQTLAREYAGLAEYEENQMYDSLSAQRFAAKGLAAARGRNVPPEDPERWSIRNREMMGNLQNARLRLLKALADGAATKAPAAAARAQVNYDCWVEQSAEGWQYSDIAACRNGFMQAMNVIERSAGAPVTQAAPPAAAPPPTPGNYIVFFDWNRATLRPEARSILKTAADNARQAKAELVMVVGHADRSGPDPYNLRLSQRRAEAVRNALVEFGLDRRAIRTEARGEREPLVPTDDGVREPQNRRVTVTLRGAEGTTGADASGVTGAPPQQRAAR